MGRRAYFYGGRADKFAGYFRDTIGQDYAMARYYSATAGAFWSPDQGSSTSYSPSPGWLTTVDHTNPLAWNRYLYGLGDPINLRDPSGAIACDPNDDDGCDPDAADDCGDVDCTCVDNECTNDAGGAEDLSDCTVQSSEMVSCTSSVVVVAASPITVKPEDNPSGPQYSGSITSRLLGNPSGIITINPVIKGPVITTPDRRRRNRLPIDGCAQRHF